MIFLSTAVDKDDFNIAISERIRASNMLDAYSFLLTDKQRRVCTALLEDDISSSELAEELGVSRQGIHDLMKRTMSYLAQAEEALGLLRLTERLDAVKSILRAHRSELDDNILSKIDKILGE